MDSQQSFGRSILLANSAESVLELERAAGRVSPLRELDEIVERLVAKAFQHTKPTVTAFERGKEAYLRIDSLTEPERQIVDQHLSIPSLNQRGAWSLPEDVTLRLGLINLPSYFRAAPRYAHSMAADARLRTELAANAETVLTWSILEPMFDLLMRPLDLFGLRGHGPNSSTSFDESVEFLRWTGLASNDVLGPLRSDPPQFGLNAERVLEKKLAFLSVLHTNLPRGFGRLYRAHLVKMLATQYYSKAKQNGRAKRKQVITKALTNEFVGAFLGDWPALVAYLGEEIHTEERLITSLPEPKLQVASRNRAAEVAAAHGIPVEEVERMAASLWGVGNQESPVHERVRALTAYWKAFDNAHARQESGMKSLWGLMDETNAHQFVREEVGLYDPYVYRDHLAPELAADIEKLWGSTVLTKYPYRVVSEPFPHTRMAELFGPALKFWNGCGLTTWFFCEGPYSRTDLKGLADYHAGELARLDAAGCPVSTQLFKDLIAAQKRLGREEPIEDHSTDIGMGVRISVSTGGVRRKGFSILRDIVTTHRRAWAQQYLTAYLDQAWRAPLSDLSQRMVLDTSERGKPPTLKQFAKNAVPVAADWFGGDMAMLYAAIGQNATFEVKRRRMLPADVPRFIRNVLKSLAARIGRLSTTAEAQRVPEYLAVQAPYCVQLWEALDRTPTSKDFGESKLGWMATNVGTTADVVFEQLAKTVGDELGVSND